jgi:hypothetical protein
VDLDPELIFLVVVLSELLVKTFGVLELADFVSVDFDGRHQPDPTTGIIWSAVPAAGNKFADC